MGTKQLREQFSVKNLSKTVETLNSNTKISKLDLFFSPLRVSGFITEWGATKGRYSRLIPALVASSFESRCLWIMDEECAEEVYPPSWKDLGFNLNQIHFLKSSDPFAAMRVAFNDDVFKFVIFDSQKFLSKGDLNFIYQSVRDKNIALFLMRHFFLTNRNGNPFSKSRFNTSFDLRANRFNINTIKGRFNRRLSLKLSEVFDG